jgi:hypothetical protein
LTSDGGVLVLAQAERTMVICRRLAECIADPRDPSRVVHRLEDILRARMFAIACGYEDADDLDALRDDPGFRLALVENGWRVLFARTSDLVQRLQVARRELALESALAKLDKYHLLVLDDFAYISRDQAETSVLFELISARYERRSMLITANQPFGEWNSIFPDPAMTLAAVDRLVHHATIFEMNVESYRRRTAEARRAGPGRPATFTTPKVLEAVRDNQDDK